MLVFGQKIQGVFKEYSNTKNGVFKEYSKQVYYVLHRFEMFLLVNSNFEKAPPDIICPQFWNLRLIPELLWYNPTLFPIRTKIQGVFIILEHLQQKFFFSRAFQAPLTSKIKFQSFSRTSRSSTNPDNTLRACPEQVRMLYHWATRDLVKLGQ